MRVTHTLTDTFICKYYNNNIIKKEVCDLFPDKIYLFIISKINEFNQTESKSISYDQYTYLLYLNINEIYKKDITMFKDKIKRIK